MTISGDMIEEIWNRLNQEACLTLKVPDELVLRYDREVIVAYYHCGGPISVTIPLVDGLNYGWCSPSRNAYHGLLTFPKLVESLKQNLQDREYNSILEVQYAPNT